jgi:hypothetical protein
MQRFDLRKLNYAKIKEQYQVNISYSFASLENLDDYVDISGAWEYVTENVASYALQQHKSWFDEEC